MEDNAAIARRLYDDWNERDFDHLAGLVTDDCDILLVGSGSHFRGPQGARAFSQMWADGFPDGKVTVERVIAAGQSCVIEHIGRGTHTGTLRAPGGDLEATGRSVTLELCDVFDFRDGMIRSMRSYFDSASLLMQIGAMPAARVEATT